MVSAISDASLKQHADRKSNFIKVGSLLDPSKPKALIAAALREMYPTEASPQVASYVYASCGPVHQDDVVLYVHAGEQRCGQAKLHCHVLGQTVSLIEDWQKVPCPDLGSQAGRYKVNANCKPYLSTAILTPVIYSVSDEGLATVLIPPLYR